MTGTPAGIVRRVLSDPTNPAVVTELVAEDSVYVSLNYSGDDLKKIMPWAGTGQGRAAADLQRCGPALTDRGIRPRRCLR